MCVCVNGPWRISDSCTASLETHLKKGSLKKHTFQVGGAGVSFCSRDGTYSNCEDYFSLWILWVTEFEGQMFEGHARNSVFELFLDGV